MARIIGFFFFENASFMFLVKLASFKNIIIAGDSVVPCRFLTLSIDKTGLSLWQNKVEKCLQFLIVKVC